MNHFKKVVLVSSLLCSTVFSKTIDISSSPYNVYPNLNADMATIGIQRAIDSLSDGSTLYFPPGAYNINSQLYVNNKTDITINCKGAKLVLAIPFTQKPDIPVHNSAVLIHSCNSVTIDGLSILGNAP